MPFVVVLLTAARQSYMGCKKAAEPHWHTVAVNSQPPTLCASNIDCLVMHIFPQSGRGGRAILREVTYPLERDGSRTLIGVSCCMKLRNVAILAYIIELKFVSSHGGGA